MLHEVLAIATQALKERGIPLAVSAIANVTQAVGANVRTKPPNVEAFSSSVKAFVGFVPTFTGFVTRYSINVDAIVDEEKCDPSELA